MVLSFRLYGEFQWPPRTTVAKAPGKLQSGAVEIHYREKNGFFQPVLVWRPKASFAQDGTDLRVDETVFSSIHDSIFKFKIDQAVSWFGENAAKTCAIWIDDEDDAGKKIGNKDWVSFRGAFLFEQHRTTDPKTQEQLDLRWPLVRSCEYVAGRPSFSALTVGRREGARYSLNFNLPLPARRATLTEKQHNNPDAFPMGAVYEPNRSFASILNFTTLVGGWLESDTAGSSPTNSPRPSFVFADTKFPNDTPLGGFGFSARGERTQGGFAIYEGKQKKDIINGKETDVTIDSRTFWPRNSQVFTQDVLKRIGFAVDQVSETWPALSTGGTTSDLSLRFPKGDPRKPNLVYRIAVSAGGGDPKNGDDIRKGTKGLSLRLEKETGGWIETSGTLYADCKLSWTIPDKEIWEPARWAPKVDVILHWTETISDDSNFGSVPGAKPEFDVGLLRHAAHAFSRTRNALAWVEAGQPRSILPDLAAKGKQVVRFALYGPTFDARFEPDGGLLTWGKPGGDKATFIRPRLRLTLARPDDLIPGPESKGKPETENTLTLTASAQTFFNDQPTQPTNLTMVLSSDGAWADAQENKVADGDPFFASYRLVVSRPATNWSGRLSSLKFQWTSTSEGQHAPTGELTETYLRAGGPGIREGMSDAGPPIDLRNGIAASIRIVLPVSDVRPVGVDVARMDRSGRSAPLLIDEVKTNTVEKGYRYWLSVTETIAPTQDRWIEAGIYESADETLERSYVVLSQEPFSIFRYRHRPLGDRGDVGSASVATYSGDDRIWQYRKVTDHYHYILPPQAIGEGTDKPRRLEIHDLPDGDEYPLRPYVTEHDEAGNVTTKALKRRAVDFRLTPSTELWIRPSDVERGYFMPESTSYEIFRQRGEYGLGAALAFLRGEFLYGLSVGIDVSRERSVAAQARVADIEAMTGKIAGPASDADADETLSTRWNALSRAVVRRPERLEVWARDPDSAIDFTPARFSDGVTFALRGTALHRAPLDRLENGGETNRWPKIGRLDADEATSQPGDRPRIHPQGLSGGALWPVESVNLFNELLERPQSSGGTIESIALSPTGGDATQKAAFLGGIVTIISETRNGHVERQKVEVLGRVGAFWHRAKHVVVYERSVNASDQFAPRFAEDEARTRSRRPILRKVREYVELIEHERGYPDFKGVATRCAGFLERVCFHSKTINVDSAWSTEIGDYGWKIPLWNRLSARERPQVYPMPDIAFLSTAEGDGDRPVVAQECIDTDNLFFFADFKADTSDTDRWLQRLDIDYANMPCAKDIAACADARSKKTDDDRRRPVSRILPGTRRFTWRLAPAAQKSAINAGRAGKPVYVGLESVSFMRASHSPEIPKAKMLPYSRLLSEINGLKEADVIGLPYWGSDGAGNAGAKATEYSTLIGQLLDGIEKPIDQDKVRNALSGLKVLFDATDFAKELKDGLEIAAKNAGSALNDITSLKTEFDKGSRYCDALKADAVGTIRRKEMLICTALSDWTAEIENHFTAADLAATPPAGTSAKQAAINTLSDRIVAHLQPVFADASADVGKAGEDVEKAKAILLSLSVEIEAVFERVRERIRQFSAGYDRQKPWSAERIQSFVTGLQSTMGSVATDIAAAIDEARQRLAVELGNAGQAIAGHLSKSLVTLSILATATLQDIVPPPPDIGGIEGDLAEIGRRIDLVVATVLEQIAGAEAELCKQLKLADDVLQSVSGDVESALKGLQDALGPKQLLKTVIRDRIIRPALETLLRSLPDDLPAKGEMLNAVHAQLTELSRTASALLRSITAETLGALEQVSAICGTVFEGAKETQVYLEKLTGGFAGYIDEQLGYCKSSLSSIEAGLGDLETRAEGFLASVKALDYGVRSLQNDLSRSIETARLYGDRVMDAAGRVLDGGVMALPSNALKLYSAVSSAPELAALKADIDRIRSGFDDLSDIIDTTQADALFNGLGDDLKALGLTLPFDKIADRLIPVDLSTFDIGKIFGNFGGINLDSLFSGYRMPAGVGDAIRVTHDFDKAQARAWVQVDVDAPMPGRRSLFSLGVFQVDFVDMRLTGQVRLEASKDTETVTQTGHGRIDTMIDIVVGGQSMVKFRNFALNFSKETGLVVEFDPKNIELNPSFKFIQDFLSTLFPDEAGGLTIVKQDNIPVGVEHAFVIPPMTLNFGTSGVSNISIENRFKLIAFPDFMIANRFNLSTIERPFIFSIFVIGGTGYIQIDAEYRPFDNQLMVAVEAGAGGSAALAFAVGPFAGQVFITMSGTMTYRKMIGQPGGGLSLSVVVVIAGHVEVCGMVTVGITLMLRLSYSENGDINGQGSLSVSIRISRFFTLTARANANYKLRGGKSETSVSTGVSGTVDDKRLQKAQQAVEQLSKAGI